MVRWRVAVCFLFLQSAADVSEDEESGYVTWDSAPAPPAANFTGVHPPPTPIKHTGVHKEPPVHPDESDEFSLDVEISMSGKFDEVEEEKYIYAIDVTAKYGQPWRVMHSFNDFHSLAHDLGHRAEYLQIAPFPARTQQHYDYRRFIAERRSSLEAWLQKLVQLPESSGPWKKRLQEFLHPKTRVGTFRKDIWMRWFREGGAEIQRRLGWGEAQSRTDLLVNDYNLDLSQLDVTIAMSGESDEVIDTRHIFAIDVTSASGESRQVMHRFNAFHKLLQKLGDPAKTISGAPFPKVRRSALQAYDDFIVERRKGLATWLQAVLTHRNSKGPWAKALLEFLNSEAPGVYFGEDTKATIYGWRKDYQAALVAAHAKIQDAPNYIKEPVEAKFVHANLGFAKALTLGDEFKESMRQYNEAVSELEAAQRKGSKDAIEAAKTLVDGRNATMREAGERVQHYIDNAEHILGDIQELTLLVDAPSKDDL
mmetsp:Transcript_94502/g.148757  ORF Transcript_94502/g.148757 Transcript_94502/m.148757 type:complete len:481 (+) Transcript_94502:64-1506(+)